MTVTDTVGVRLRTDDEGLWAGVSVLDKAKFVQAKHFTDTGSAGRSIDLLVLHFMVMPEEPDTAEKCARYFETTDREASAHLCVDNNSVVRCVRDEDVAWAAPGANSDGLQIEMAGTTQTVQQWADAYSKSMLELTAVCAADLAEEHGIPTKWCWADDLRAGRRGFTDHWEVSKAFGLSTHSDCGQGFRDGGKKSALHRFMADVRANLDGDHDKQARPERTELPDVRVGDTGWLVKKVQKHLIRHGYLVDRDGHFGPATERMVKRFQRDVGLTPDGIVGRQTWRALRR